MRLRLLAAAAALALAGTVAVPAPANAATRYVSARTLLGKLTVSGENHAHRYSRASFHYGIDADGDGCYTRKEVLIQEHIGALRVSRSCAVYGTWKSFFDNRVTSDPYSLEVDHLVPLAEAWYSGAWAWSAKRKTAFGNDLGYSWSLNAVTASANQTKGADDPAEWLPKKNKCTYVKAWIAVKYRWHLTVNAAERSALARVLNTCTWVSISKPGVPDLDALT